MVSDNHRGEGVEVIHVIDVIGVIGVIQPKPDHSSHRLHIYRPVFKRSNPIIV